MLVYVTPDGVGKQTGLQYVSAVYNVAAILCLQFMVHLMLFPMINDILQYT
jgi:hypothetical protein